MAAIREFEPIDGAEVDALLREAFAGEAEARLVRALRAAGDVALELVAEDADGIAGMVLFSKMISPRGALAMAPLAVAPRAQGKGFGGSLIAAGLARAEMAGWLAAFVLGAPGLYARHGFSVEAAAHFPGPYPARFMLARALCAGGLADPAPLVYAPAFAALGS